MLIFEYPLNSLAEFAVWIVRKYSAKIVYPVLEIERLAFLMQLNPAQLYHYNQIIK